MEQRNIATDAGKRIENRVEVFSTSRVREEAWAEVLADAFATVGFQAESIEYSHGATSRAAEICIVDARIAHLEKLLTGLSREGRSIFLLIDEMDEGHHLGTAVYALIDDVLVYPFRNFELESKIRLHHLLRAWSEVNHMNVNFQGLLSNLGDDVALAERLQKSQLPVRFPQLRGFRVRSRYLAGMRSGGDHFDLAESKDGSRISAVLADSSSYGLASAFLHSLMRVAMKLSRDEVRSASDTVRLIQEDLGKVLNEKDQLSLIYGVISRKDLRFRYLHVGTSVLFHAPAGGFFVAHPSEAPAITQAQGLTSEFVEREIVLNANDRLVLLSDGYVERAGGVDAAREILNSLRAKAAEDSLNAFTFEVKRRLDDEDAMPEQDCTAVIFDVDAKTLKLA